jgi:hypothetical protein
MTYLAQILGTALMGVVSASSPARLGQMDNALRQAQHRKARK